MFRRPDLAAVAELPNLAPVGRFGKMSAMTVDDITTDRPMRPPGGGRAPAGRRR
jgi:hypothetical protein